MKTFTTIVLYFICCNATFAAVPAADASPAFLQQHVQAIVHDEQYRNYKNIPELNRVAAYIKQQIESYGISCYYQSFSVLQNEYRNVICEYRGISEQVLVVGAHYDVFGEQEGADDNASGVAGLIELSRLLAESPNPPPLTINFVAYTLEEPPFFATEAMGSYIHAQSLQESGANIFGMISLEMIGFFSDEKIQDYPAFLSLFYPDEGNFIAAVSNFDSSWLADLYHETMTTSGLLPVETLSAPSLVTGVDFSDHRNYWLFDYPAIMITDTAFFRNKHYHQPTDTVEKLNFEKMSHVITGLAKLISTLKPHAKKQ